MDDLDDFMDVSIGCTSFTHTHTHQERHLVQCLLNCVCGLTDKMALKDGHFCIYCLPRKSAAVIFKLSFIEVPRETLLEAMGGGTPWVEP